MRGHKPQKGNQFGGHAGPYNMNNAPLINKVPPKHGGQVCSRKHDLFFKPSVSTFGNINAERELLVACLFSVINGPK